MEENNIYQKQVEQDLYNLFISFLNFTFDIIGNLEKDNNQYKFAVVNMQITLELFLKYYFIRTGRSEYVFKSKKRNASIYKDFSDVLNSYFKVNHWSYMKKKELLTILETRNSIVHRGMNSEFNIDIIKYIVKCVFFIHGVLNSTFGELLLSDKIPKLITSRLWTKGVNDFLDDLICDIDCELKTCFSCGEYTVIAKEIFDIGEPSLNAIDDLVCLNCFEVYEMEPFNTIINCHSCFENSYFVDLLNPQKDQLYAGVCSECGMDTRVRKCSECGQLYHPSEVQEVIYNNKYYCSNDCLECYKDSWGIM